MAQTKTQNENERGKLEDTILFLSPQIVAETEANLKESETVSSLVDSLLKGHVESIREGSAQ